MGPTIQELQAIIDEATRALGPAWMYGGVSLAEGIRPGATLVVEHGDGSSETTTYGGDR